MAGYDSPGESRRGNPIEARVVGHFDEATELAKEAPDVRSFTPFRDHDFYADAMQVEEWAVLNDGELKLATSALTLKSLVVGIDQASEVAAQLAERAERAQQLAGRLRQAARAASDHGLVVPTSDF
jgi:hypothetical protein